MKPSAACLALAAALACAPALAWETTLLDTHQPMTERRITSAEMGIQSDPPFTITTRLLHGGRQEGVSLVEIDNGAMVVTDYEIGRASCRERV